MPYFWFIQVAVSGITCIVPVPPSLATMVDNQHDSSQAMPWTSASRTEIAGGFASSSLSVGLNGCPEAVLMAVAAQLREALQPFASAAP